MQIQYTGMAEIRRNKGARLAIACASEVALQVLTNNCPQAIYNAAVMVISDMAKKPLEEATAYAAQQLNDVNVKPAFLSIGIKAISKMFGGDEIDLNGNGPIIPERMVKFFEQNHTPVSGKAFSTETVMDGFRAAKNRMAVSAARALQSRRLFPDHGGAPSAADSVQDQYERLTEQERAFVDLRVSAEKMLKTVGLRTKSLTALEAKMMMTELDEAAYKGRNDVQVGQVANLQLLAQMKFREESVMALREQYNPLSENDILKLRSEHTQSPSM